MGTYHPHGDLAIYDALARMAQDFSLRHMLVDGHGSFGGRAPDDSPAAMRYTECRLAPLALELLAGHRRGHGQLHRRTTTDRPKSPSCFRRGSRTCS